MIQKLNCIMLIDDDKPTNFLHHIILEEVNLAEHIQIEDGSMKALNYLTKSKHVNYNNESFPWPDIIFLDINMPAINGWEFLDQFKAMDIEDQKKIIIIMLTTSLNPDDQLKASKIPEVSGFEIKPLTPELIGKIVEKYFIGTLNTIN